MIHGSPMKNTDKDYVFIQSISTQAFHFSQFKIPDN
jgi:hypothetical protein